MPAHTFQFALWRFAARAGRGCCGSRFIGFPLISGCCQGICTDIPNQRRHVNMISTCGHGEEFQSDGSKKRGSTGRNECREHGSAIVKREMIFQQASKLDICADVSRREPEVALLFVLPNGRLYVNCRAYICSTCIFAPTQQKRPSVPPGEPSLLRERKSRLRLGPPRPCLWP